MKFRYKKYGADVLRPVIPIEIAHDGKAVRYEALVDSGADFCIFDAQIGEILGLDIESGMRCEVAGITGVAEPYYVHPITVIVGGWKYRIEAGFLPGIGRYGYGVVGQKGFFDLFVVKFDLLKREIEMRERH